MLDELKRVALFTSGVAELTRNRAEQFVKDWVKAGDVRRDQAQSLVMELVEWSRQNRRDLLQLMRSEIQSQIEALGLATKRDVERLERRVKRLEAGVRTTPGKRREKSPPKKKVPTKSASESEAPPPEASDAPAAEPESKESKTEGGAASRPLASTGSGFVDPTSNP